MAPNFLFKNGKLITRDAGLYNKGSFWSTWLEGSIRLETPFNDIRRRNIGNNGIVFDPLKHPIHQKIDIFAFWSVIGSGGYYIYDKVRD